MLASNVHPKIASERLGHSKIGITLDLYSHVLPNMQADAAAIVDDALQAAVGIDHDAARNFSCLVNPVDDLVFTVRLVKAKFKSLLLGDLAAIGLDIGKSFVTVDVRLTFAEQI